MSAEVVEWWLPDQLVARLRWRAESLFDGGYMTKGREVNEAARRIVYLESKLAEVIDERDKAYERLGIL